MVAAGAACLALGGLGTGQAEAASIVLTDSAPQTFAGQDFNFNFSPVEKSDGTDGIFTVRARGDYSIGFPQFESLSWDIDGIVSETQVTATPGNLIQEFSFNDVLWEQSFTIGGLDLLNITSDSVVSIVLDLLPGVNLGFDTAFVEARLEYESEPESESVPEPASILGLMTVGALGVGSALKRKKKQAA